jgi:hypothetical protein
MGESDIQRSTLDWSRRHKILCWRNNSGAFVLEGKTSGRFFRTGANGASDIIGCRPNGRFLAKEVKRPRGQADGRSGAVHRRRATQRRCGVRGAERAGCATRNQRIHWMVMIERYRGSIAKCGILKPSGSATTHSVKIFPQTIGQRAIRMNGIPGRKRTSSGYAGSGCRIP